jgi:hypothetical protein
MGYNTEMIIKKIGVTSVMPVRFGILAGPFAGRSKSH